MRKTLITAALIGLSIAAGPMTTSIAAAQAMPYSTSRFYPEKAILDWSGQRFTIIRIDSLDIHSEERARLESWMRSSAGRIEDLQNTILANRAFAAALRARSVQLNNVVAIQRAMNGNLVVYLR